MSKANVTKRSEFLARCIPMLRGQICRLIDDRETAHEALQEVILTVLSTPTCPDDMPRFAAYCREVVHEVLGRDLITGEVLPWDDDPPEALDPLVDPEQAVDTREELAHLVDPLGNDALELLVRRYVLGENANEIARTRAQTPAAMRVRLMRLRSAARAHGQSHD